MRVIAKKRKKEKIVEWKYHSKNDWWLYGKKKRIKELG